MRAHIAKLIFASRWLQLPLYFGLIAAQGVFVLQFLQELYYLVAAAMGHREALTHLLTRIGMEAGAVVGLNGTLALIDVVMISNLLIMVIVGGFETFVSRMGLENHRDRPAWLSHVDAGVLKVKLATAIIGISSIHLLKTFINIESYSTRVWVAQLVIHLTFLLSALALAHTARFGRPSVVSGLAPVLANTSRG